MTDIIEDNVQIDLQIGTEGQGKSSGNTEPGVSTFDDNALFWDIIEMKVEITQVAVPNYVKGKVTPQPETVGFLEDILNGESDESDEDFPYTDADGSLLVTLDSQPQQSGQSISFTLTDDDGPIADASVQVNDEFVGLTNSSGRDTVEVPSGDTFILEITTPDNRIIEKGWRLGDDEQSSESASNQNNFPNNGISKLVGSRFRLEADNDLVAVPDDNSTTVRGTTDEVSPDEEDNLLFDGRLANISPIGTNRYEIIAYDPGQQAFNIGGESGSIVNQKLEFTGSSVTGIREPEDAADNNVTGEHEVPASELVQFIIDEAGIGSKSVVDLASGMGVEDRIAARGHGQETLISFKKSVVPVKEALNKVREQTRSEWWFDKDGTFYFGDPAVLGGGVETYEVSLITDTTAGISTPPYQSVRVIGSGVATTEGWASNSKIQDDEDKIVKEVNIGFPGSGGTQSEVVLELDPESLFEPTFKYINAEVSTDESAQNTALKIADDLIKQQASGKVTVVGFPEVRPFDGIQMPNTEEQPMGGQLYDVYAVRHKLNATDGFLTEIEVAGPNPEIRGQIDVGTEGDRNIIATSIDRDVYTPDGERRAFGPGAGRGNEPDADDPLSDSEDFGV